MRFFDDCGFRVGFGDSRLSGGMLLTVLTVVCRVWLVWRMFVGFECYDLVLILVFVVVAFLNDFGERTLNLGFGRLISTQFVVW